MPFGPDDLTGRTAARKELLSTTGLDGSGVLFGMVGRMTGQKGLELLDPIIDELIGKGFRLVAVGNGDQDYLVDGWAARAPGAVWHGPYTVTLRLLDDGDDRRGSK